MASLWTPRIFSLIGCMSNLVVFRSALVDNPDPSDYYLFENWSGDVRLAIWVTSRIVNHNKKTSCRHDINCWNDYPRKAWMPKEKHSQICIYLLSGVLWLVRSFYVKESYLTLCLTLYRPLKAIEQANCRWWLPWPLFPFTHDPYHTMFSQAMHIYNYALHTFVGDVSWY